MRKIRRRPPPPKGLKGTLDNTYQCLDDAGIGGASAGIRTSNALGGGMDSFGASLGGTDQQGSTYTGGQNSSPMRLSSPPMCEPPMGSALASFARDVDAPHLAPECGPASCSHSTASALDTVVDCGDTGGGSGAGGTGGGTGTNCMTSCCLNAALFGTLLAGVAAPPPSPLGTMPGRGAPVDSSC